MADLKPAYIFQIDEICEQQDAPQYVDAHTRWHPVTLANSYQRRPANSSRIGATGAWWFCNGVGISRLYSTTVPEGATLFKTYSMFYSDGFGYYVLEGDATQPAPSVFWRALTFDHDEDDYSSTVCYSGSEPTMRCHNPSTTWPKMLLPDIYHGPATTNENYGGLIGELPIILALIAFSVQPQVLTQVIPQMFQNGEWVTEHNLDHGRRQKRGVIVSVYAYRNNEEDLTNLEDGDYGQFFE